MSGQRSVTENIEALSQFGQLPDGSVTRLVYDDAWVAAMTWWLRQGQQQGMQATIDSYGNGFLTYPGSQSGTVAVGSHIDSVQHAGHYDGAYGIVAAQLAMTRLVARLGQPQRTMMAIAFSEEEGSRFPVSFTGSRHYSGVAETDDTLTDAKGVTFNDARQQAVQSLSEHFNQTEQALPDEFMELHIEQGPLLESTHDDIGVVSTICELEEFVVTLTGEANHAGTTPMHLRHDALMAAVQVISQLDEQAHQVGEPFVFTVGQLEVSPGSSNVIPGQVRFTIDIRHPQRRVVDEFEQVIRQLLADVNEVRVDLKRVTASYPEVRMDPRLMGQFEQICQQRGLAYRVMPSGAAHDTQMMNAKVPTAMLFVPSHRGISHSVAEYTSPEALENGVQVLMAQLYQECY
ncbi:Zn-dependent hydrolase [Secundilactobacillus similis]|uniref:Amidase, hydantoinase carbamoylase family n=1 Tax=Secundilactobacillus similis DSM 23365 = JCM 2765 TaxID=1423804 RepID=A0A0R2EQA1_9LACO|nr:Zn-dependent hydrolase [Secundilactobacillus similis]KRN18505.1 amidase, hydantoinase carbamoylase family [Secundilactobacillus similis DSM 23365 = JCM 2765]